MYLKWKFHYEKSPFCVHFRRRRGSGGTEELHEGIWNNTSSATKHLFVGYSKPSQRHLQKMGQQRHSNITGWNFFIFPFSDQLKCVSIRWTSLKAFHSSARKIYFQPGMEVSAKGSLRLESASAYVPAAIEVEIYMKQYFASPMSMARIFCE